MGVGGKFRLARWGSVGVGGGEWGSVGMGARFSKAPTYQVSSLRQGRKRGHRG